MKIATSIEFEVSDLEEMVKEAYIKKLGVALPGYHLVARERYGQWLVETEKDVEVKEPEIKEATTDGI